MTVAVLTPDFLAWCDVRGMTYSDSPPVLWGLVTLYDHEREVGLWPDDPRAANSHSEPD